MMVTVIRHTEVSTCSVMIRVSSDRSKYDASPIPFVSRSCLHLNLGVCCRFGAVRWSRFLAYIKWGLGHNTAGAQRRAACDRIRFTAVLVYLQTTERRAERGHDKFGSKHTRRHVIQWLDQPNYLSSYQRVPCAVEPPGRLTKG